jgi:hypothetical protein
VAERPGKVILLKALQWKEEEQGKPFLLTSWQRSLATEFHGHFSNAAVGSAQAVAPALFPATPAS